MTNLIYHNPRCSKSRQTLELLKERNIDTEIVEYLKNPPTANTIGRLLDQLGLEPRQLMRHKEPEYTGQGLDDPSLSRAQLIDAMCKTPKLIERPIVVTDKGVAIGRPPENILKIL